ncbi:MAG TPA: hypothetical protein VIY73_00485, partial [Polyangiaceae bacterium]
MADAGRKVVWVLGAGFSAGLGGPLLPQLLSPKSERDIKVRYADKEKYPALHSLAADVVRNLYRWGLVDGEVRLMNGLVMGERLWTNAEEFIDYLDTAGEPATPGRANPHAARLQDAAARLSPKSPPVDELRSIARHLIAAECCSFGPSGFRVARIKDVAE